MTMSNNFNVKCPKCNEEFLTKFPVPNTRALIKPVGIIYVFTVTSDDIKRFLSKKAKYFKPEVKIELGVKYCEKKNSDPHRGYAALTIAFSDHVIKRSDESGWFDRIGENDTDINFIEDILAGFIYKYRYDKKELDDILSNYKKLEEFENRFGMTESFIEDIKLYTRPKRVAATNKESWIFFSARAEKVIEDMLEDQDTNKVNGRIEIHDVYPIINKDVVEYVIYLHPQGTKSTQNPRVRELLGGKRK